MMYLGRHIMGGMRKADTWVYENGGVLENWSSPPSVRSSIPRVLGLCPLIYTSIWSTVARSTRLISTSILQYTIAQVQIYAMNPCSLTETQAPQYDMSNVVISNG